MRKRLFATAALFTLGTCAFAYDFQTVENVVKNIMPGTTAQKITKSPLNGIYTVFAGDNVFYVDPKQKLIIFGEIYSQNGTSITKSEKDREAPLLKKQKLAGISGSKIKGILEASIADERFESRYALAIFTNPKCPHCKRLEEFLQTQEVDTFFVLLGNPAENEKYLSAENPALSYRMKLPTESISEDGVKKNTKASELAQELGVTGTPTVIVIDRQNNQALDYIVGADLPQITKWIQQNKEPKGAK